MPLTNDYPFKVGEKFRVIDRYSTNFKVGTEVTLESLARFNGAYKFKGITKLGYSNWYWMKPEHLELQILGPTCNHARSDIEPETISIQLYPLTLQL